MFQTMKRPTTPSFSSGACCNWVITPPILSRTREPMMVASTNWLSGFFFFKMSLTVYREVFFRAQSTISIKDLMAAAGSPILS